MNEENDRDNKENFGENLIKNLDNINGKKTQNCNKVLER